MSIYLGMSNDLSFKHLAFTLAEVLITLGVIGVVAAITMPTLIQNIDDKHTVVALKKVYSELNQAYSRFVNEHYDPLAGNLTDQDLNNFEYIILPRALTTYYKKINECNNETRSCLPQYYYKELLGHDHTYGYGIYAGKGTRTFITANGVSINMGYNNAWNARDIFVDINGYKKPNRFGYDIFGFEAVSGGRIVPKKNECNLERDPNSSKPNGYGCTSYVIRTGNLDYKKCIKGNQTYCNKDYSK